MSHEGFYYCFFYSNSAILLKQTLAFSSILQFSHNTPCLAPNIFHLSIVFSFSLDDCNTQEKWLYKICRGRGGGGGANQV